MTNIIKNRNAVPAPFESVLDQLFPNTTVSTLLDDTLFGFGTPATAAIAPVNIQETTQTYEIELAAPGLRKSDFQLKIEGDTLSISFDQRGDRESTNEATETSSKKDDNAQAKWIRREFTRPSFRRHFELAESIDREKISAQYENGVLSVSLPKKENVRQGARLITIN